MEVIRILAEIDAQIEKLQQARSILSGGSTAANRKPLRKKRQNTVGDTLSTTSVSGKKPRNLSPEARKRIADAQKRRWAEQRKQA